MIPKKYFKDKFPSDPLILDVGAYDCKDSWEFLELFPNSTIYAFDPLFEQEKVYVADHRLLPDQTAAVIHKWKVALSDINGPVEINLAPNHLQSSSLVAPKNHLHTFPAINFSGQKTVESLRLDDWAKEYIDRPIDLLWVDVNGAESHFLMGASNTVFFNTKYFYTEYSENRLYDVQLSLEEIQSRLGQVFEEEYREYFYKDDIGNVLFRNKRFGN